MSQNTDYMGLTLFDPYDTDASTPGQEFVTQTSGIGTVSNFYKINNYMKDKSTVVIKTETQWNSDATTILRTNDFGVASDSGIIKRGDGTNTWVNLSTVDPTYNNFVNAGFTGTETEFYELLGSILTDTGDASLLTVEATQAGTKANVTSGDTIGTIVSKLMKWYASFGTPAWASFGTGANDVAVGNHTHSDKLSVNGDGSNVTVTATTAATKVNLTTGDTLSTTIGKLMKWFSSFGVAAWLNIGTSAGTVSEGNHTHTASDVGADPTGSANAVQSNLNTHTQNTTVHVSSTEKSTWNGKQDQITYKTSLDSTLQDNTVYAIAVNSAVTLAYPTGHYLAVIIATTGASGSVVFPSGTTYLGGAPTIEASKTYEITIMDGRVSCQEVAS